ncbi:MAG: DUF1638 domain-containing protein [Clostridia bacterium]|nr:DUF1638 domain-containing protein [Clostridia bacterium]
MLRLKVIACDVLNREISYLGSQSECFIDVTFLHQGLHNTPDELRKMLQDEIDRANKGFSYNYYNTAPHYDYIILGYGLCSNGVAGLSSSTVPLVIPRGHDCITLLLGSKDSYKEHFEAHPGTYWFSSGWIERGWQPSELKYKTLYKEYCEKYGEDNAEFLMDMEQGWMKDYNSAALITWDCLGNKDRYRSFTEQSARFLNWNFIDLKGDHSLLQRILNGIFNEDEVLIVPPGRKVVQSFDDRIIMCE